MIFKIISMLIILAVLSVLPMIYTGKFDPSSFIDGGFNSKSSGFADLQAAAPESLSTVVTDEKVEVYRWRDENGVMQFSNTPPPAGTNAEQVRLDPNSNLMQSVKQPRQEEAEQVVQTQPMDPYSFKGMTKAVEDAKAVEQVLQQRHEAQQKMLNDL